MQASRAAGGAARTSQCVKDQRGLRVWSMHGSGPGALAEPRGARARAWMRCMPVCSEMAGMERVL